ncbi:formyltransferase family protein [Halarcobacter bivalviorum]|uniref:Formyltransferase domain-containing protein n=1 Tax=Halarcobacter bivalviorum TaxID=663364 RepID=A0AAX2A8X8_9BACT|nr:formyltransferase family protein [Halarcobacter bivalviorum]AXH13459.1 formyltransferase domain-containing protein [Halarcobacter bivalviorum]RXK09944.1 methionyl-tRNA formyltransferase [Halarcobacter bivalviorum]
MKIVFIGTVEFSKKALQKLVDIDVELVGVCTKEKSSFNSDFADLTPICKENKIPFNFVEDINSKESINWIKDLNPDIIFCFGWSSLIKNELLSLAPMGVVGYHPAKLPQNRGRHPIIWALALGLKRSASTFFFMDEKADSGDIISQKEFEILDSDDAKTLYDKIIQLSLIQIEEFVPQLKDNTYTRIKQDQALSNIWRKRNKADGKIDFRMSSKAIYNLVRALTKPYVGAHIEYKENDISIWKVKIIENNDTNIESGKVIESNEEKLIVKTYDAAIEILEHEFKEVPKVGEYL